MLCRAFVLSCLVAVPWGHAVAQGDAWSTQVAVADRSVAEQNAAYQVALRSVLLANSPDKTLLNRDEVRAVLPEARLFVEQFRYFTPEPGTRLPPDTPITEAVRRVGQATQVMQVSFDPVRLSDLIAGDEPDDAEPLAADPFASLESALVWMLIEDEERKILVDADSALNVVRRARELAGSGSVALQFPDARVLEREPVDPALISEADLPALAAASARYPEPVTLIAHLMRDPLSGWHGQWTRVSSRSDNGKGEPLSESTRIRTSTLDESLQQGINWLLSARGAAVPGRATASTGGRAPGGSEALMWVSAVDSLDRYARLLSFVKSVESVQRTYPRLVSEKGMVLAVIPRVAMADVADAAARQDWLRQTARPVEAADSELGRNAELVLELVP